jgi:hypothetical protein
LALRFAVATSRPDREPHRSFRRIAITPVAFSIRVQSVGAGAAVDAERIPEIAFRTLRRM